MSEVEPRQYADELLAPPPRQDAVVARWTELLTNRARRAVRIVKYSSFVPLLIIGSLLAPAVDGDTVTRVMFAFVPALWIALPITLVVRRHHRWNVRQSIRFVRDGVACSGRVVGRGYLRGAMYWIRVAWNEQGRVVIGSFELPGGSDIDAETVQVTVLAIPGDKYVAAVVGRECLAVGRVKPRAHLRGGDSGTGAITGMPTARVVTPRNSREP